MTVSIMEALLFWRSLFLDSPAMFAPGADGPVFGRWYAFYNSARFIGANVRRCRGQGPCAARAAMCAAVPYPLWRANP